MITKCQKCNKEFDNYSKWGEKKFCSRSCANSRIQTEHIKHQKSKKLGHKSLCDKCGSSFLTKKNLIEHKKTCISNIKLNNVFIHSEEKRKEIGKKNRMGLRIPSSITDMSARTSSKIMKRLNIGCFNCGWNESSCDIHHIIPRKNGGTDNNKNLTYLCPNCHRLAHNNKLNNAISIEEKIGEKWREYYYAHE